LLDFGNRELGIYSSKKNISEVSMKYLVPSSKIVFTDFMILLVSVLMGLNSVMSFSEDKKEVNLPPVNLPSAPDVKDAG